MGLNWQHYWKSREVVQLDKDVVQKPGPPRNALKWPDRLYSLRQATALLPGFLNQVKLEGAIAENNAPAN